jgi:steroid 5-alpha reductase family enzyme
MTVTLLLQSIACAWAASALVMLALWARQLTTRDSTNVDVAWAANLALIAVAFAWFADGLVERRVALASMAAIACGRLALHLFVDRARKRVEDGRYAALRARWGPKAPRNFFVLFQVQAALDAVLSLPFLLACWNDTPWSALDTGAVAVGIVGVVGESLADRQLAHFKVEPANRGRTCRAGLWRFSRHPNYFFQWLLWCAYAALAQGATLGWLGLVGPIAMLLLILFVSGIPPTEAQALRSRGDDYRDYQRTTSAFVPWFPRRGATRRPT